MQSDWKKIVADYRKELEKEKGLFSVKDICDGLLTNDFTLEYWSSKNTEDIIRWLGDLQAHTEYDIEFRMKWIDVPNMQNIVNYNRKEIEKLDELIRLLRT